MNSFKIFAGNFGRPLAEQICEDPNINMPLGRCKVGRFNDGEIDIEYLQEVRGEEVYIIQPLVNSEAIIELCLMIDAACRSSAEKVIAITPYLACTRQERKSKGRVPISAKWIVDTIINSGADRICAVDLHAPAIQGFVTAKKQLDNLYAHRMLLDCLEKYYIRNGIFIRDFFGISPDHGGAERVRKLSDIFKLQSQVIINKYRREAGQSDVINIIGNFQQGQRGIMIDDIIDTGGSIINGAEKLFAEGSGKIDVVVTHGIFSQNATERLQASEAIENIFITDTYPIPEAKRFPKLKIVSVAPMLAQAIKHLNRQMSLSILFEHTPPYKVLVG